jgi:hypothetical protein
MAFQLKANESVGDGITRNVRRQIEKALQHLRAAATHQRGAAQNEAVREVRKCLKKVRAALRLVREELGDEAYHEENWFFRDAARPLTQLRDAQVLVEILDKLKEPLASAVEPEALTKIHEALLANQWEVTRRVVEENKALAEIAAIARRSLARIAGWGIELTDWATLGGGLKRVYRTGHRALALASQSASVENLHEWRKQAMYLWHQLQLIEGVWMVGAEPQLVERTHQLSTLLGENHDLAVFHTALAADPSTFGGHRVLKAVFAITDRRRMELERQAFVLGRELYKDSPKLFTTHIEELMSHRGPIEE